MGTHPLSIVTVHTGDQPYVHCCLRQAQKWNPGNPVILLGDSTNTQAPCTEHFCLSSPDLSRDIGALESVYQHLSSSQAVSFERFCIARWFYIRNWMQATGQYRCLAIDSDVLLFCRVDDEAARFYPHAMTFGVWGAHRYLVHCNFILDRSALEEFCDYVLSVYTTPKLLERVKALNRKKFGRYWISDMSLFYDWANNHTEFPWCLQNPSPGGDVAYDDSIDNVRDFYPTWLHAGYARRWKRVRFVDGVPYSRFRGATRDVPMHCLHYHGRFKSIMQRHAECIDDDIINTWPLIAKKISGLPYKLNVFAQNYLSPLVRRS